MLTALISVMTRVRLPRGFYLNSRAQWGILGNFGQYWVILGNNGQYLVCQKKSCYQPKTYIFFQSYWLVFKVKIRIRHIYYFIMSKLCAGKRMGDFSIFFNWRPQSKSFKICPCYVFQKPKLMPKFYTSKKKGKTRRKWLYHLPDNVQKIIWD